jgi:plastocyanin
MVTVSIRDFYFEPSQLVVEPGTTVQWVNEGTTQHTVFATSPAGAFRSGTLHPGESFTHTFPQRFPKASPDSPTKPGTYEYLCEIHPGMRASVTFSESGGKALLRGAKALPCNNLSRFLEAGKVLLGSLKTPPFNNLLLLLQLVALMSSFLC